MLKIVPRSPTHYVDYSQQSHLIRGWRGLLRRFENTNYSPLIWRLGGSQPLGEQCPVPQRSVGGVHRLHSLA